MRIVLLTLLLASVLLAQNSQCGGPGCSICLPEGIPSPMKGCLMCGRGSINRDQDGEGKCDLNKDIIPNCQYGNEEMCMECKNGFYAVSKQSRPGIGECVPIKDTDGNGLNCGHLIYVEELRAFKCMTCKAGFEMTPQRDCKQSSSSSLTNCEENILDERFNLVSCIKCENGFTALFIAEFGQEEAKFKKCVAQTEVSLHGCMRAQFKEGKIGCMMCDVLNGWHASEMNLFNPTRPMGLICSKD